MEKRKNETKQVRSQTEETKDGDVIMKDACASNRKEDSLFQGIYRVKQINPKGKKQFHTHTLILEPVPSSKGTVTLVTRIMMDVCKSYEGRSYCEVKVEDALRITVTRSPSATGMGYRTHGTVFKKTTSTPEGVHVFVSCSGLIVDLAFSSCSLAPFEVNETIWFCLRRSK